jgi:hypothetical protein
MRIRCEELTPKNLSLTVSEMQSYDKQNNKFSSGVSYERNVRWQVRSCCSIADDLIITILR